MNKKVVSATTEDLKNSTVLLPEFSPWHINLLLDVFIENGIDAKIMPSLSKSSVNNGLRNFNNDMCYPLIIMGGQVMEAIKNHHGNTPLVIVSVQTGGVCRASNYVPLIKKAINELDIDFEVKFLALNFQDFSTIKILFDAFPGSLFDSIKKIFYAVSFGDLFLNLIHSTRPYEVNKGETDRVYEEMSKEIKPLLRKPSSKLYKKLLKKIVKRFEDIKIKKENKPKVAIVGEIFVKYNPFANNELIQNIERNGGEAIIPGLFLFLYYDVYSNYKCNRKIGIDMSIRYNAFMAKVVFDIFYKPLQKSVKDSRFYNFESIEKISEYSKQHISCANQSGEGWLLTGEITKLLSQGIKNIICVQPFGCLPNHIIGKGMNKVFIENYNANMAYLDFDPGSSKVNIENRVKLLMSIAKENQV